MVNVNRLIALQIGCFLVTGCIVLGSSNSCPSAGASNAIPKSQSSNLIADLPAEPTGPLAAERKQISELMEQARQKGTNVSSYENVRKYIEDSIKSGAPPDSIKHTADDLITHLTDEINGVKHPVTVSNVTSTASSSQNSGGSHKSGAEQYSKEMNKLRAQQNREAKQIQSHNFWQKFHDESGHHH